MKNKTKIRIAGLITIAITTIILTACLPERERERYDVLHINFTDDNAVELVTETNTVRLDIQDIDYHYVKTDTESEEYLLAENLQVLPVQKSMNEPYTLYVPAKRYDELNNDYKQVYGEKPQYLNEKRDENANQ